MIQNRELKNGMTLIARHKGQDHKAEVIEGEDGKPMLKFPDGKIYKSVSSAGTAITGSAINGWNFWTVEGGEQSVDGQTQPVRTKSRGRNKDKETKNSKNEKKDDAVSEKNDDDGKDDEVIQDGEKARIHCEECDLNFSDSLKASEHFNEVHSAA